MVEIADIRLKKPLPRVVVKKLRDKAKEAHRVTVKEQVFKRDQGICRCCRAHATELHELRFRSLGGKRSLHNSIAVCTAIGGNNCHRMLQVLVILYRFVDESAGANGDIEFTMGPKAWTSSPSFQPRRIEHGIQIQET